MAEKKKWNFFTGTSGQNIDSGRQIATNVENEQQSLNRISRGQHILKDEEALDKIEHLVNPGGNVLEIGPGPGTITGRLAKRARKVVGIEIDRGFEGDLSRLQEENPNVNIEYRNALETNLRRKLSKGKSKKEKWQVFSNLPFQISEPFLRKLVELPIDDAVLILGERMTQRIQNENPESLDYSRTGALVQTFFDTQIVRKIPGSQYEPEPSTDSYLAVLTPKDTDEVQSPKLGILRRLFQTEKKFAPTGKVIKEAIDVGTDNTKRISKPARNRYNRRESKRDIRYAITQGDLDDLGEIRKSFESKGQRELRKLGVPEDILNKPFAKLDNQELRQLVAALNKRYE
jgi:16S rRNA (adenine1518-N6/adenine1519-N6)-dimethyltransferase